MDFAAIQGGQFGGGSERGRVGGLFWGAGGGHGRVRWVLEGSGVEIGGGFGGGWWE